MKVFESLLEMFDKGLCLGFGETRDVKDHVIVLEDVSDAKALGMNGAKAKEIDGIGAAIGGGEDVARVARIGWIEKEIRNLGAGDSLHLLLCELVEDKEMTINALALFASQCGLIVRLCGRDQQFFALCGVCHVKVSDQIDALLRDTANGFGAAVEEMFHHAAFVGRDDLSVLAVVSELKGHLDKGIGTVFEGLDRLSSPFLKVEGGGFHRVDELLIVLGCLFDALENVGADIPLEKSWGLLEQSRRGGKRGCLDDGTDSGAVIVDIVHHAQETVSVDRRVFHVEARSAVGQHDQLHLVVPTIRIGGTVVRVEKDLAEMGGTLLGDVVEADNEEGAVDVVHRAVVDGLALCDGGVKFAPLVAILRGESADVGIFLAGVAVGLIDDLEKTFFELFGTEESLLSNLAVIEDIETKDAVLAHHNDVL